MYIPDSIQSEQDYQNCITFHGHTCMGVTIGYLAAKLALKLLGEMRAVDEELIVIVENDACCCDAIQVLTGCTFGKGNFFFLDHGKMAFTFGSRASGQGVRLLLKEEIFQVPEREQQLATKIGSKNCTAEEQQEYQKLFEQRGEKTFKTGAKGFFDVEKIETLTLPPLAPRAPSKPCGLCGEMVMETKLSPQGRHLVCKGCQQE